MRIVVQLVVLRSYQGKFKIKLFRSAILVVTVPFWLTLEYRLVNRNA